MPYSNQTKAYKIQTSLTNSHKHKLAFWISTFLACAIPFKKKGIISGFFLSQLKLDSNSSHFENPVEPPRDNERSWNYITFFFCCWNTVFKVYRWYWHHHVSSQAKFLAIMLREMFGFFFHSQLLVAVFQFPKLLQSWLVSTVYILF